MNDPAAVARAGRPLVAALALIVLPVLLAGCSDEIVCSQEIPPFISTSVTEVSDSRAGTTLVEFYCSGDPVPEIFSVAVGGRELPDPLPDAGGPGLVSTLSETAVIWLPGVDCVLSVGSDYGIASAVVTVPGPLSVAAPETGTAGEQTTIAWTASSDADYYLLEVELAESGAETTDFVAVVEDTSFTIDLSGFQGEGYVSGHVAAVSGPLPGTGAQGNVTGEGWGFMRMSYRDSGALFSIFIAAAI